MIALRERAQVSLLQHVLFSCFDVDSFGVVNCSVCVANADDFDAALVGKRKSCHRAHIAKSLHDGGAFLGIHLQHVHGPLDQVNNTAPGCFASAFGAADGDRFASNDFIDGITHVNGVGVHEPGHDLFVGTHVGPHDVGMWPDKGDHFLHVSARDSLQFPAR